MHTKEKKMIHRPLSDHQKHNKETAHEADARRDTEATTPEYREGAESYMAGSKEAPCPYPSEQGNNHKRYLFFQGFYGAGLHARGIL